MKNFKNFFFLSLACLLFYGFLFGLFQNHQEPYNPVSVLHFLLQLLLLPGSSVLFPQFLFLDWKKRILLPVAVFVIAVLWSFTVLQSNPFAWAQDAPFTPTDVNSSIFSHPLVVLTLARQFVHVARYGCN